MTTTTKQTQFNFTRTTGVNPMRTHGFGVYKGRRVVWSVRVDEKLLKQAIPVLRGWFGSDCRGVETLLAGLVAASNGQQLSGVNPSRTSKIEIGKLVIERNLRSRRKLVVDEETEATETITCKPKAKRTAVDYSGFSLEQLRQKLEGARQNQDVVAAQVLAFEVKKRMKKAGVSSGL